MRRSDGFIFIDPEQDYENLSPEDQAEARSYVLTGDTLEDAIRNVTCERVDEFVDDPIQ